MQPTEVPLTPPPADQKQKQGNFFLEIAKFSIIALIIVLPIRFFVAQPFIVSGSSMSPTFETGEYLIVDELSYRFEEPKRGDVVILKKPKQEDEYLIKRIIGMPNETVTIKNGAVTVKDGAGEIVLEEPYVINKRIE